MLTNSKRGGGRKEATMDNSGFFALAALALVVLFLGSCAEVQKVLRDSVRSHAHGAAVHAINPGKR